MAKKYKKKKVNNKIENTEANKELFSFDDEIVIGVTKNIEPKKNTKKVKNEQKKELSKEEENQSKNKKNGKKKNSKRENSNVKKRNTKSKNKIDNTDEDDNYIALNTDKIRSNNKINNNKKYSSKKKNNKSENNSVKINNKNRNVKTRNISQQEQETILLKKARKIKLAKYSALCALFIVVVLCAMFSPLFNIKTIEVEGTEITTENEIISLSQIKIDQNMFKFSKNKVTKQIKENAYIKEVIISRKLPSTISIKIEERKPAYILEYAESFVYVDKQGYIIDISEQKLDIPILQGEDTTTDDFIIGKRLYSEDLEKLAIVNKIMEIAQSNEIDTAITGIDIKNKQNLKLIFGNEEKIAYLGDQTNLNTKILMIKAILEKEQGKAGEILVNMDLNKENPIFRERV